MKKPQEIQDSALNSKQETTECKSHHHPPSNSSSSSLLQLKLYIC